MKRLLLFTLILFGCSAKEEFVDPTRAVNAIRFERQGNLIFVPVRLNESAPRWFVLDSGSSRMLIDDAFAETLNLPVGTRSSVQGAGLGRIAVHRIATPISLQIGDDSMPDYQFDSIDLTGVSRTVGRRIDGILGYELFSRYVVTIDYAGRTMTLDEPSRWQGIEDAAAIDLTISKRWPMARGTLHVPGVGDVTDEFLIDVGSGDAINHPAIKKTTGYLRQTMTGVGLGFPTSGHIGTATRFTIGPYSIPDVAVACCGATEATSKVIGGGILSRFTCAFDYSRKRLYLKPNR